MSVYIPDENGALTALADTTDAATQIPTGDLGSSVVKMLLTLVALIALLFVSYWFLRRLIQQRMERGNSQAAIQILEKRMISPKTMLYLVQVEGKKILLGESHLEIRRLHELEEEES